MGHSSRDRSGRGSRRGCRPRRRCRRGRWSRDRSSARAAHRRAARRAISPVMASSMAFFVASKSVSMEMSPASNPYCSLKQTGHVLHVGHTAAQVGPRNAVAINPDEYRPLRHDSPFTSAMGQRLRAPDISHMRKALPVLIINGSCPYRACLNVGRRANRAKPETAQLNSAERDRDECWRNGNGVVLRVRAAEDHHEIHGRAGCCPKCATREFT